VQVAVWMNTFGCFVSRAERFMNAATLLFGFREHHSDGFLKAWSATFDDIDSPRYFMSINNLP